MSKYTCHEPGCENAAEIQLMRIDDRSSSREKWVCQFHVRESVADFLQVRKGPPDFAAEEYDLVPLELRLIRYDRDKAEQGDCFWIYLQETSGSRYIVVPTGYSEAFQIGWEVKHLPYRRPPSHRVVSGVISAMGGRLEYVVVHDYDDREAIYTANLHIAYGDTAFDFDVRPSDAIAVALGSNVPILASRNMFARISQRPPGDI
jgi:bifunctional DNase/RNase